MFKRKNSDLDSDSLTEAVQRTIDRLVFIRFLEDKLIEPSTILDKLGDEPHPWKKFIARCREFDKAYNGITFKEHPVIDRDEFEVDDRVFTDITDSLADKYSPYHFNYIPIHILGSIYERFLGSVIVATAKCATVEQKPEVRKAGGVFYTPQYIVKYIVENTIGSLLSEPPAAVGGLTRPSRKSAMVEEDSIQPPATADGSDKTGRVYFNDRQYFSDVPEAAWNFYIGGYQPAQKWLKDRKGRVLSFDDIQHYQKIIVALTETGRLMQEIDKINFIDGSDN